MARLIFKSVFIIALLLVLVIISMNNKQTVELDMQPLVKAVQKQPAAIIYFGFFSVGFLAGAVLMSGRRGGGGKAKSE
ncbi:MAG: hypothetical protein RLY20_2187 [Verrucomicrobiota bacterium]|jgi:uncharacterized integral membrane protein